MDVFANLQIGGGPTDGALARQWHACAVRHRRFPDAFGEIGRERHLHVLSIVLFCFVLLVCSIDQLLMKHD
jgi:hypothetical protein